MAHVEAALTPLPIDRTREPGCLMAILVTVLIFLEALQSLCVVNLDLDEGLLSIKAVARAKD